MASIILISLVLVGHAAPSTIESDLATLTATPHRLAGSPAGVAAASNVAARVRAAGVDRVIVQPFDLAHAETVECTLTSTGMNRTLTLAPMRPNGIMLPVTPPDGITARLIYVGAGGPADFLNTNATLTVQGAIAVVDCNCHDGWMRAFRLGARAIIAVQTSPALSDTTMHLDTECNFPRFFYPGPVTDLPIGADVTLHSNMQWERGTGHNVFGFIKGTNAVFSLGQEETIVLAAPLDTYGEVPTLAPGARAAANMAALLDTTRYLAQHRPARNVLVAFFDADFQGHIGAQAFYRTLESEVRLKDAWVESRQTSNTNQLGYLDLLLQGLDSPTFRTGDVAEKRQLLDRLKDCAKRHADALNQMLFHMRKDKTVHADSAKPSVAILEEDKFQWNELRRSLGRGHLEHVTKPVEERLHTTMQEVRDELTRQCAELKNKETALASDRELHDLLSNMRLVLHIDFLLGDSGTRWGVMPYGGSGLRSPSDAPTGYEHVLRAFRDAAHELDSTGHALPGFVVQSVDGSLLQSTALLGAPQQLHRAGDLAGVAGVYSIALASCYDPLTREGTMNDTYAQLNITNIEQQAEEIRAMLTGQSHDGPAGGGVLDAPGLSVPSGITSQRQYVLPVFKNRLTQGPVAMGSPNGGAFPDTPMPDVVVQFRPSRSWAFAYYPFKTPAYEDGQVQLTSQEGSYLMGPIAGDPGDSRWYTASAGQFSDRGELTTYLDQKSIKDFPHRLNLFNATGGCLPLPPQRVLWRSYPDQAVNMMSALANATLADTLSSYEMADGVLGWQVDRTEPSVKIFSLPNLVLLNNSASNAEGRGIPVNTRPGDIAVTEQSAGDLLRLDASRLAMLRAKNITDHSLTALQDQAQDYLSQSAASSLPLQREALAASSFWLSQTIYKALRQTLDDLVFAVMILLTLSVPFAFTLERVLLGATTIHRQILGFAGLFALTFLALYCTHPAFAIANTPAIIFLGFTILIMSTSVIVIIMRRFESELKLLQGLTNTVHVADVSRFSTFVAAMQMGISTMRRRPMRTALTATTVLLLTFTILCFASFRRELGPVRIFASPSPRYSAVYVHDVNWGPISFDTVDVLRGLVHASPTGTTSNEADLCRRVWMTTYSADSDGFLLSAREHTHSAPVHAILGLDDEELAHRPDIRELLGNTVQGHIFVTAAIARRLNVVPGQSIELRGRSFEVGPILQPRSVALLEDIGQSHFLPVDFTQPRKQQPEGDQNTESAIMDQQSWTSLSPDSVVIVGAQAVQDLGGLVYGVSLYTKDTAHASVLADRLTAILSKPVLGTRDDGVYWHVLGTVLAASGAKDLFFPILLGGLVIFGTMLGSVSDREREIYTFSALGLAPRHVATLFLSESMVYALIGGMGGYLLAQGTLAGLVRLSHHGWLTVPEMNVSSTNTIVTILIIMATVLVSALYPAIRASRSANPGLMRTWRPPRPDGNILQMVFPFTVSQYDATGILAFLREHFGNHGDVGLGQFLADGTTLSKEANGTLRLASHLSLAPFDLGVSQDFLLQTHPSDIPGIDEIHVRLERLSGQPNDWQRLNKPFLDDLRRQLLIWRSLPPETVEAYRHTTLQTTGDT